MTGSMSGVDPDQVEADTGMFWRTLYKLEKNFSDTPEPLKMAQKVWQTVITYAQFTFFSFFVTEKSCIIKIIFFSFLCNIYR